MRRLFTNLYGRAVIFPCITHNSGIRHHKCFCTVIPKKRDVILFPGQGSQFVGMTKSMSDIPAVKQLFETANNVLGYDLMRKCLSGPKDELDKTVYCQPAVFVASLAALEKYKETQNESLYDSKDIVTAGFSVGEFAALVLSKSLTFEDALRLIDVRAKAMQKASDEVASGMVTVSGLNEQGIKNILRSAEEFYHENEGQYAHTTTLNIAIHLYSKGFVLAGHQEAVNYVLKFGIDQHDANHISQLTVSGAFHTPLMKSAQAAVAEALKAINVQPPQIKVYSNVTGNLYESSEDIKSLLPRQLMEPVKWHDIMSDICAADFEQSFYELGPGRQLTGILAKIDRRLVKKCKNIEA